MTFKEFGQDVIVEYRLTVLVNDEVILKTSNNDPEFIEEELGRIERHNMIHNELIRQYEELPEPIEDEETGRLM